MDMNEWLVGLNDPQNASTKPPLGVVPGKDTVYDDDRPDGTPFCIIDIIPAALENPKDADKPSGNTIGQDSNGLLA